MSYLGWAIWISLAIYLCAAGAMLYGLFRGGRRGEGRPAGVGNGGAPSELFVSVIVAARNEERRLPGLLGDLAAQTYENFEVIVVDDRSRDRTADLVREAAQRDGGEKFRLVQQKEVPAGASPKKMALQKGVEAGRGEILLLTDADCRVRPTWVARMAAHYAEPDTAMVLGYSELIVDERSSLFERVQAFEFLTLVAAMAGSARINHPFGATGQNISYRRRAFDAVGGYSSVMHRIAGDDMLMMQLIKNYPRVGRIVYADDAGTYNSTYPEKNWKAFQNQRARWASSGTHHFRGDWFFAVYAVNLLMLNMTVLFGAFWAWAGWITFGTWIAAVAFKLGADSLFYALASIRFRRAELLRYLPWWFLSQPIYILAMAVWGQRRHRWVWKP